MPIEIRELVIKTEIVSVNSKRQVADISMKELEKLKLQVLEECKRMIYIKTSKNIYKR